MNDMDKLFSIFFVGYAVMLFAMIYMLYRSGK